MSNNAGTRAHAAMNILVIGHGAIGRALIRQLESEHPGDFKWAVWTRSGVAQTPNAPKIVPITTLEQALAFAPALVVECAGHSAVEHIVPDLLATGIAVVVSSVGVLADTAMVEKLNRARLQGKTRVILPAGAIGGLDYLNAVAHCRDLTVTYTSRKPPAAWVPELAALGLSPADIVTTYTLFEGPAQEAARLYPKNLNVAATLALHGAGMQRTTVRVVVDPTVAVNTHEIQISSEAGRATFTFENMPSVENPKTSMLTALSVAAEVIRFKTHA